MSKRWLGTHRIWGFLIGLMLCVASSGCMSINRIYIPYQGVYPSLKHKRYRGKAVARVYAAPLRFLPWLAVHPWIVIKRKHKTSYIRWEVFHHGYGEFEHVHRSEVENIEYWGVGAKAIHVLGEIVGKKAEDIDQFLEKNAARYPCRNYYQYYPGPNSNTFVQWVLTKTRWNVRLPPTAIGAHVVHLCLAPWHDRKRVRLPSWIPHR